MGIVALFSVFLARKYLLLWSLATCSAIAACAGLLLPKQYEATSIVQVDAIQRNTLTGNIEARTRVSEFLGQQAAVAGSRSVALKVIETLTAQGAMSVDDFVSEWRRQTGGETVAGNDARLWAADQLLDKVTITADALESTLSITFRADAPGQAARFANAFSDAYMQTVLDIRRQRARRNAADFGGEREILETELEGVQNELSDFRDSSGIVPIGSQRLEGAEVQLASLTARLAEARADAVDAYSLLTQVENGGDRVLLTMPIPGDIGYARQAQGRLGAVISQLSRIAERYGEAYPDYIEAQNEKRALEVSILNAVRNRAAYHQQRVARLEAAARSQKKKVVALQKTKQEYDVLEKRVEASRATYDLVATRSLQESLQSRVHNVSTFLLARAVPPSSPATPPLSIIILIGMVAGATLGSGAAVAIEFVEGRVRTPQTVKHVLKCPILAEAPLPRKTGKPKRRRRAPALMGRTA